MDELENIAMKILNICESNPDTGLKIVSDYMNHNPILKTYPFLKWCKARAYQIKGLQPLIEKNYLKINNIKTSELCSYFNNKQLYFLELALLEIRDTEDVDPGFIKTIENHVDGIASALERCRPGRVQEIIGSTKMQYFGVERISILPKLNKEIPPKELRPFFDIFFNFPSKVICFFVLSFEKDRNGHKFISGMLFNKLFEDFEQDETYGDAEIGVISLFDDGTYSIKVK